MKTVIVNGLEIVVVIMAKNTRLWSDGVQFYFEVHDYKQTDKFNSEDEVGHYYRYYIRQKDDKRFEDVSAANIDPYSLELREIDDDYDGIWDY